MARKIRVGIIPAAGQGTRMGYLSSILPKCLFPVYDRPIIHHVAENMIKVGVERILIVVHYQKEKIIEYFHNAEVKLPVEIEFVEQSSLQGIANAVALSRDGITEPFLVILGDDCTITKSLSNVVELFYRNDATVVEGTIEEKDPKVLKSTCCLQVNKNKQITRIVEKPRSPISSIRGCGVYVLHPRFFDYIENTVPSKTTGKVEMTDVIGVAASDGGAYGEPILGSNVNINSYEDLLRASLMAREKLA